MTRARVLAAALERRPLVEFNPEVPSLGLSMATPWGPIDLVAVERAVRGHTVKLDAAEYAWLCIGSSHASRRNAAADRLGMPRVRFEELVVRWRTANLPALTTTEA